MRIRSRAAAVAISAIVLAACGADNGTETDAETGGDPGIGEADDTQD